MRREKAAVPETNVTTLDVFIRKFSSPPSCPTFSLSGSVGGFVHGFGRYLRTKKLPDATKNSMQQKQVPQRQQGQQHE